jgi:hypothetical protein
MDLFCTRIVMPDAAKRLSAIHNLRRFDMNSVPARRDLRSWIAGSRFSGRAPV